MSSLLKLLLGAVALLCSSSAHTSQEEMAPEDLTDLLYSSMQSIVSLNVLVTQLTQKVAELTINFADIKADVEELKTKVVEVAIVSGEEGVGDKTCAKVCAGSTGRTTTNWRDYSRDGVYTNVDISECGFVKIPSITTALEGGRGGYQWKTTTAIYSATTTTFRIQVRNTLYDPQGGRATAKRWNVEWIAVGFTC